MNTKPYSPRAYSPATKRNLFNRFGDRAGGLLAWLLVLPASLFAQGPLNPPGPPAPMMKTLDQVEARRPIMAGTIIKEPGSYYLAADLTLAGTAITIATNNVVFDLRGFTITGTATGSGNFGIHVSGSAAEPRRNVVVRNGAISGFYNAVEVSDAVNCVFEGLTIRGPASRGFNLRCSASSVVSGNTIRNTTITQPGAWGILFIGAANAQCRNNLVEGCVISNAGDTGIQMNDSTGEVTGNRILRSVISSSTSAGIAVLSSTGGSCSANRIEECSITDTGTFGIVLSAGGGMCHGNAIRSCAVSHTGLSAIYFVTSSGGSCDGNVIEECSLAEPGAHGIYLLDAAQTAGNLIRANKIRTGAARGIFLNGAEDNRIEYNHVFATTGGAGNYGISTTNSQRNLIIGNSCVGHAFNYLISTNDTYGPIVSAGGALATTGVSAHPAANFSR